MLMSRRPSSAGGQLFTVHLMEFTAFRTSNLRFGVEPILTKVNLAKAWAIRYGWNVLDWCFL